MRNTHEIFETEGKCFLFEIYTRINSITSPLLRDTHFCQPCYKWLVIYPMSGNNTMMKIDFTDPRK